MRLLYALLALLGSPAVASEAGQDWRESARGEAIVAIDRIGGRGDRSRTALYVAGNLMEAGHCGEALPFLRTYLRSAPAQALAALFLPAARARDARCAELVADHYVALSGESATAPVDRLALRFRAATLFRLSGDESRAAPLERDDLSPLGIVAPNDAEREFDLGTTRLVIGYADPPTLRQKLVLDSLRAFVGTPHFLPALQGVALRAQSDRRFLNEEGWAEIAASLAQAGDEATALSILPDIALPAFSPTGLRAETALRAGRLSDAAEMLSQSGWYRRRYQRGAIAARAPLALFAHISEPTYWDMPEFLAEYATALDMRGARAQGEAAAAAALTMFVGNYERAYFCMVKARLLARVGRVEEAQACVTRIVREGRSVQAMTAGRLIAGLAWRGDGPAIERYYREISPAWRAYALQTALTENCGYAPAIQVALAREYLALRRPDRTHMAVGVARAGCDERVIEWLVGDGPGANHQRYRAARAALAGGHPALAERLALRVAIGSAPADSRLYGLAEIHWRSGNFAVGHRTASRIASPALRARALISLWRAAITRPVAGA